MQSISLQSSFIMLNIQQDGRKPELIRIYFYLASLLDSTKIATVAHTNRKTRTKQADVSVKTSHNYCLKAKPSMGTSFSNFSYAQIWWESKVTPIFYHAFKCPWDIQIPLKTRQVFLSRIVSISSRYLYSYRNQYQKKFSLYGHSSMEQSVSWG